MSSNSSAAAVSSLSLLINWNKIFVDYVVEKLVWMLLRGSVKSIYIWLEVLIGCKWKNGEKHSHLVCLSEQHWWEPGVMVFAKGWNINLVWRFIPTFNLLLNMHKNVFCQIYLDQPKILKAIWNFFLMYFGYTTDVIHVFERCY